jgi:putative peptide zinc metalloprotease protein
VTEAVAPPAAGGPSGGGSAVPARADGITLIGEMQGSGYRTPPSLARRADGQTVQLTPLLYATVAAIDGRRSYAEVASVVAEASGKPVSEQNVRDLVDKLRPMGLVVLGDGSAPALKRSNPLLGLRFKVAVTDEEKTRRITAPFAALFSLVVAIPVLLAFAWITWWVLFDKGLASATHEAFARPGLLLAVLAITVLSAGFHEFGHAAAARRGGATPGVMGAGLYLVWPAFYTDVTDSYRLNRVGRLRTDLGGLYFNAIVAVATVGVWWATQYDAILLLVATQILQMLRQLLPFVRFDGYHVLADLTGVPDLFQRIGPVLRSLTPWRPPHPEASALKPWARVVVTAWVLTVVPVLLGVMVIMVLTLPRLIGTAWASAVAQQDQMMAALGDGDVVSALARALAMVIVVLPIAASAYVLVRLVRQVAGATVRRTRGKPLQRVLAGVTALAVMAGLVLAWWPSETRYRPIQAYEAGTVSSLVAGSVSPGEVAPGDGGSGTVMWPEDAALPSRDKPQLATVLVPRDDTGPTTVADTTDTDGELESPSAEVTSGTGGATESPTTEPAPASDGGSPETSAQEPSDGTWIFPFDEPLAPDEGDTQALSVNTTDDTVTYDVAFALVWADGTEPVDNTNEAYALASCTNCAAIAVAFQVVLVVGEADVAVPQNLSVAVNYDCTSCLTYSLAVQLFLTLDGPLSDESIAAIEAVWEQIATYGANIAQVPLSEIQAQLTTFEQQIIDIVEKEQGPLTEQPSSPTPSDETSSLGTPGGSPSDSSTPSPSESTPPSDPTTPTESVTPTEPATTPTESPTTIPTESTPSTPSPTSPSPTSSPTSPSPSEPVSPATSTSAAP